MSKMTLSEELSWRGFIKQTTIKDIKELDNKKIIFYHGYDASADSQTIGNLAAMMFDKVFLRHGHKAVILAGGATSMIGDPGGKDKERPMQSEEVISFNVSCAEKQLKQVFKDNDFTLVNNIEWFKSMNVIDYLRGVGKHFSMTPLIQRDYIAKRIGEDGDGISYTEFSYTILQGYDFLYLYRKYGVNLQLAGSDQWGNSLSGIDLIRRVEGVEVDVITLPLVINKTTGKKFGKSEDGAVWLDENKTSVFKFYQFWLNIDDEGCEEYLKIYTELDKKEIDSVLKEFENNRSSRYAQKVLAKEITSLLHGRDRALSAEKVSNVLFGGENFMDLNDNELELLSKELATVKYLDDIIELIVSANLATSKTEARNLVNSGAINLNGNKISLDEYGFIEGINLLKKGKNSFVLVKK